MATTAIAQNPASAVEKYGYGVWEFDWEGGGFGRFYHVYVFGVFGIGIGVGVGVHSDDLEGGGRGYGTYGTVCMPVPPDL
ncbi:hypothetical protein BofuT4_uP136220.1 [Botrytis cinerea T4]|uniref:Uncharacterized protein n=1 Tax=Botryotinia fuckeliana (strain T4) TaxID=999810 RepID=G2YPM9_BOTF4|nr:hypothetical protein BofuT4_uP136220.1 [Botrytis cinerea T4]